MKKQTVESILEQISNDPLLSDASKQLSEEEKEKVNGIVKSFVENFVLPLEELVKRATEDPEIKEEIRALLISREAAKKDESK